MLKHLGASLSRIASVCTAVATASAFLAAASSAPALAQTGGFADVPDDAYYSTPVAILADAGVLAGTECEDGFCPNDPIDRKTMAVWMIRVVTGSDPSAVSQTRFTDIGADSFHAPFVESMAQLEITTGCGDGTRFCPDDTVTRAQMAAFLARAYNLPDGPDPAFSDVPAGAWYAADVARLAASGITQGCGDGTGFCPGRATTRAQMAVFLARAAGLVGLPGATGALRSALRVDAAEIAATVARIDAAGWAVPRGRDGTETAELLLLVDADELTDALNGIDFDAIDAAAKAAAYKHARAAARAARVGYEVTTAWDDHDAAVEAARWAASLAHPWNRNPAEFRLARSFDLDAFAAAYDENFAGPNMRGIGEAYDIRAAVYARTPYAIAARAAARAAAIAAMAPVFEAKAISDAAADAYYDAATDTYTDRTAYWRAYSNTRLAVNAYEAAVKDTVGAAYDAAYIAALGFTLEVPWWRDEEDPAASLREAYYYPVLPLLDAFEDAERESNLHERIEAFGEDSWVGVDEPLVIATDAENTAYFFGDWIHFRDGGFISVYELDGHDTDADSVSRTVYEATYYHTYAAYLGHAVGSTVYYAVWGSVQAGNEGHESSSLFAKVLARMATSYTVQTSLAAPLAQYVSDTFEADPVAATATLGAYRASDAYGIAHQMFLVTRDVYCLDGLAAQVDVVN